jgi:DNA mismatch repair protein MutS
MRQYWEQKRQAPDAILLFRTGDFYEMLYDDTELGARAARSFPRINPRALR